MRLKQWRSLDVPFTFYSVYSVTPKYKIVAVIFRVWTMNNSLVPLLFQRYIRVANVLQFR